MPEKKKKTREGEEERKNEPRMVSGSREQQTKSNAHEKWMKGVRKNIGIWIANA